MKMAYCRTSTDSQCMSRQLDALEKFGYDELYMEQVSGKSKDRPELNRMMARLRAGDQVIVSSLDRISRSTKHLIELSETFNEMGVDLISLKESIDTTTPQGRFYFKVIASFVELERELIVERTNEGLAAARARGRKGGRPRKDEGLIETALKMYDSKKHSVPEILRTTGISKATLYKYIRERKAASEAPCGER